MVGNRWSSGEGGRASRKKPRALFEVLEPEPSGSWERAFDREKGVGLGVSSLG